MVQTAKPSRISVGLSEKEYARLQALSEEHRISMAWLGRRAIAEFLERCEAEGSQLPLNLRAENRKLRA